jgi:hypothetical protein
VCAVGPTGLHLFHIFRNIKLLNHHNSSGNLSHLLPFSINSLIPHEKYKGDGVAFCALTFP